jgi:anti-sigma factor RsiW
MTCDRIDALIDDYVDGALDASTRQAADAHLATCAACRRAVEDTRAVRDAASALEPHVPPPQLWARIAAAVEADRGRPWWQRPFIDLFGPGAGATQLAAAAVVVAIVAGVGAMAWRDLRPGSAAGSVATTAAPGAAGPVNGDAVPLANTRIGQAEVEFAQAIADLEAIRQAEGAQLDSVTADVVQANIEVVDEAIDQSRAALETDPENEIAQESFFEALQSKVELLQNAIALINEMRQGDQAGAAAIVSGQNP